MKLNDTPTNKKDKIINELSLLIWTLALTTVMSCTNILDNRSKDKATQTIATTAPADPMPKNQLYCWTTLTVSPDWNCPTPEN